MTKNNPSLFEKKWMYRTDQPLIRVDKPKIQNTQSVPTIIVRDEDVCSESYKEK